MLPQERSSPIRPPSSSRRTGRFCATAPAVRGSSLLEVVVALVVSMTALLVAAPALALSLKILKSDREQMDRESALEAVWSEISADPAAFRSTLRLDAAVGSERRSTVTADFLGEQNGLWRWRLSLSDPDYAEERWLAR